MSGLSQSIYLRAEESAALRRYALEHGMSLSFAMRMALRLVVGLHVPSALREELLERLAPRD